MTYPRPNITTNLADPANTWVNRTAPKTTIVCHTMGGFFDGTGGWFRNPAAQASTNFGVAQDGRAEMYVDPFGPNSPFANGGISNPDQEFNDVYARNNRQNPNFWTVSIEHEDRQQTIQITDFPSMFEASTAISAWICSSCNIDPDAPGSFLGHYQIDSVNRPYCPGWSASTWNSYVTEVKRKLVGTIVPVIRPMTVEERIARLEALGGGNGINANFLPDGTPDPNSWIMGEGALKWLADRGISIPQNIYGLNNALTRHKAGQ